MADLHYFPLMAGDWLSGEAVSLMTPEQEGAFVHLLCLAWLSKETPCSLPNDDKALADLSRLRRKWKTAGVLVKAQFSPVEGNPSRLRNAKLWAVYEESQQRHGRRVDAGRQGGMAKAKIHQSSSNATELVEQSPSSHNHNHKEKKITPRAVGWVGRFGDSFAAASGGIAPFGEIGKHLKPLVERDGEDMTFERWSAFCTSEKRQFGTAYFVKHAGDFAAKPRLVGVGGNLTPEELASAGIHLT